MRTRQPIIIENSSAKEIQELKEMQEIKEMQHKREMDELRGMIKELQTQLPTTTHQRKRESGSGGLGRQGTVKGSLRYTAKVALTLKKAKNNVEQHYVSHTAKLKQREEQKNRSRSRLANRLQSRSRKIVPVVSSSSS
jgi:hypothetical protein